MTKTHRLHLISKAAIKLEKCNATDRGKELCDLIMDLCNRSDSWLMANLHIIHYIIDDVYPNQRTFIND